MTVTGVRHVVAEEILAYELCSQRLVGSNTQRRSVHTDPEAGKEQGLGGMAASGTLTASWVQGVLTEAWGEQWLRGGSFGIKFKTPVLPDDDITLAATEQPSGEWTLEVHNQRGDLVAAGSCRPGQAAI